MNFKLIIFLLENVAAHVGGLLFVCLGFLSLLVCWFVFFFLGGGWFFCLVGFLKESSDLREG